MGERTTSGAGRATTISNRAPWVSPFRSTRTCVPRARISAMMAASECSETSRKCSHPVMTARSTMSSGLRGVACDLELTAVMEVEALVHEVAHGMLAKVRTEITHSEACMTMRLALLMLLQPASPR